MNIFKKVSVVLVAAILSASLIGCDTVRDLTIKTTEWEIGAANKILGGGGSKSKEPQKESEDKPEKAHEERPESNDNSIVGYTKRTTEWEMREADKVISDKSSGPKEKRTAKPEKSGNVCTIKGSCSAANVRLGPSVKAAIVAKMRRGDSAEVIGAKSGWLNVKLGSGKKGWVSKALVEYRAP